MDFFLRLEDSEKGLKTISYLELGIAFFDGNKKTSKDNIARFEICYCIILLFLFFEISVVGKLNKEKH